MAAPAKATDQKELGKALANKAAASNGQGKTIAQLFDEMKPAIAQAIPKHLTPERLLRIATTSIRTNPKLKVCTPESLLGAVMQCAQLGLEPSILGHAYLVPYRNKKKDAAGKDLGWVDEAQFQIGYKGYIELARRTGHVSSIVAQAVHEKDLFEYEYGIDEKLRHVPADGDRGPVTKYYAYAKFKDGGYSFMVMSKRDIELHRDKFSKAKTYGPWVDHFDEMAKKTVLKALMKYMPISVEFQKAVSMDETTKREVSDDMSEVIDVTDWSEAQVEEAGEERDPDTGFPTNSPPEDEVTFE
ncbi:DNA-binding phage-related protein [Paenibacillus mucilaginosus 3016]|uniref:DNA-binding phage-related protein n=1 Tax=Paenibacillus mucilaginosus 3016 TaxID=1116391 RepID=H6NER4_9BACL|nr:recombination protein RecT [Paenibacillus mucilaginosus]AFC28368.1 DNA-binding phage-related protein [Paenibacillus mucilaginosus 3016]WFA17170.1 recombination protein RecT [Paenibacillus mucilaginosus]